jgi:hypothetical protein
MRSRNLDEQRFVQHSQFLAETQVGGDPTFYVRLERSFDFLALKRFSVFWRVSHRGINEPILWPITSRTKTKISASAFRSLVNVRKRPQNSSSIKRAVFTAFQIETSELATLVRAPRLFCLFTRLQGRRRGGRRRAYRFNNPERPIPFLPPFCASEQYLRRF